jgi:hypothetical protein
VGIVHLANEEYQLLEIEPVMLPVPDDPTPWDADQRHPMAALGIELVECVEVPDQVALQDWLLSDVLRYLYPVPLHLGGEGFLHPAAHLTLVEQDGY